MRPQHTQLSWPALHVTTFSSAGNITHSLPYQTWLCIKSFLPCPHSTAALQPGQSTEQIECRRVSEVLNFHLYHCQNQWVLRDTEVPDTGLAWQWQSTQWRNEDLHCQKMNSYLTAPESNLNKPQECTSVYSTPAQGHGFLELFCYLWTTTWRGRAAQSFTIKVLEWGSFSICSFNAEEVQL